ncbi:MAG: response regulator transcription factor [Spirochaetales bacterium]|jgi:DNA-binding response OmpR family regulator|nr:response regulator transcription factor [Spirochaetales bacterium]
MKKRILIVEDEPGLQLALEDRLSEEGYEVAAESNGVRAEEKARKGGFDLILLDVMLPGRDGLQICQNLREASILTPVLMLTARGSNIDTVMGLRIGADDYLTKPFDMQILIARINALMRRSVLPKTQRTEQGAKYAFGGYILNTESQELTLDDEAVALNAQEFRLLKFLIEHPNRVYSRDELLDEVWGYDTHTTTRTVDVHVAWIRQKIGEKEHPEHLITVRGYGYKFILDED